MDVLVGVRPGVDGGPSPLARAVLQPGPDRGVRAVAEDSGAIGRSRLSVITQPGQHRIKKSAAKALAAHLGESYGALFVSLDTDD